MTTGSPRSVIEELFARSQAGDLSAIDELVAEDMVNHAAGPQGREGWKLILSIIDADLGPDLEIEHHHLVSEGDLVAHHMTMRGRHNRSTMPLLDGVAPTAA